MEPVENPHLAELLQCRDELVTLLDRHAPGIGLAAITTILGILVNSAPNPNKVQHQILSAVRHAVKETKRVQQSQDKQARSNG